MSFTNFKLFKKHVRADDFAADDEYLEYLLAAAELTVIKETARSIQELTALNDGDLPLQLKQATMMLAAFWYDQRETAAGVNMQQVPYSVSVLVNQFRKLEV